MRLCHVTITSVALLLLGGEGKTTSPFGKGTVPFSPTTSWCPENRDSPQVISRLPLGGLGPLHAAGRVKLELVGDARGSALVFQQWLQTLSRAGVKNVRIRSAKAADKVGIEEQGTKDSPLYVVTGVVKSADELLLPAGRFHRRDAARLARWLDDLARYGPEDRRPKKSAFGLSKKEFARIHKEMARPTGLSTKGITRAEAVEKIGRRLSLELQIDPKLAKALKNDKVGEELSALSCGTALAYVLRPMGMCLVPRQLERGTVCAVVEARPGLEVWPVGWEPEKPRPKVLPALYEFRNVNIQNVSAAAALEAIARRLKVPVLIDHNALARHGIDPAKVTVSYPRSRTTYSLVLRKILFQARLKHEIRVDEAGQPFLWISTVKPV